MAGAAAQSRRLGRRGCGRALHPPARRGAAGRAAHLDSLAPGLRLQGHPLGLEALQAGVVAPALGVCQRGGAGRLRRQLQPARARRTAARQGRAQADSGTPRQQAGTPAARTRPSSALRAPAPARLFREAAPRTPHPAPRAPRPPPAPQHTPPRQPRPTPAHLRTATSSSAVRAASSTPWRARRSSSTSAWPITSWPTSEPSGVVAERLDTSAS